MFKYLIIFLEFIPLIGNVASSVGGALAVHFLGKKLDQKLTIEKFQEFHTLLNTEILLMEYLRYDLVDGMISERDFALMILRIGGCSEQKKKQMVKRVKKKFGPKPNPGVNFEDVKFFDRLMGCLSDIDTALGMYYAAGTSITPAELNEACKAVTGSSVSNHLVDVLFTIFDENNDGELSRKEFVHVLKSRNSRGLQKSRELGQAKLMNSVVACSAKAVKDKLGIEA
uniref:EF-hand domain-containing protein n=1 Tax=Amphimedon queenslandica TaxID=400682 RepID=A0A1X7SYK8_AMPQE